MALFPVFITLLQGGPIASFLQMKRLKFGEIKPLPNLLCIEWLFAVFRACSSSIIGVVWMVRVGAVGYELAMVSLCKEAFIQPILLENQLHSTCRHTILRTPVTLQSIENEPHPCTLVFTKATDSIPAGWGQKILSNSKTCVVGNYDGVY